MYDISTNIIVKSDSNVIYEKNIDLINKEV